MSATSPTRSATSRAAITTVCKTVATVTARNGSACRGAIGAGLVAYRKSWFAEAGYPDDKFPQTWDEYRAAGKKLKAAGRPFGQTAGHTFGDAPGFWYPYLWSWGGKEVEADGKTVVLNSKETVESVKFAVAALEGDAATKAGSPGTTRTTTAPFYPARSAPRNNGASIYIEAKRKPDSYQTADGKPLKDDILHARLPKGPAGQFIYPAPMTDMLMSYSKNQKPAKEFLRWISSKPVFGEWFTSQQGFSTGADQRLGEATRCGRTTRSCCRSRMSAARGRVMPVYAGPSERERGRGGHQIHHHRYVRQGDPGHGARGIGQVGA